MISAAQPIASLEDLRDHLQYAIGIELTTIPAYLYALYSIEPGSNSAATSTIQSVVLEEMLHMTLAANVLNAIGGIPSTAPGATGESPVPKYPASVPFIADLGIIHLQPFSPATVEMFMAIEMPSEATPSAGAEQYSSIGAFYQAVEVGLRQWATPEVFAAAATSRQGCQVDSALYYGGAGELNDVKSLEDALEALRRITHEGEGIRAAVLKETAASHEISGASTPGRLPLGFHVEDLDVMGYGWKMYSHYARFKEIRAGRTFSTDQLVEEVPRGDVLPVDWRRVRPMMVDPKAADFVETDAFDALKSMNLRYTDLVNHLYAGFNGDRTSIPAATTAMWVLRYQIQSLANTPSPLNSALRLGPPFEYVRPDQESPLSL